jgi:hypothetical protein
VTAKWSPAVVPVQLDEARERLAAWAVRARRFARQNPAAVLVGAFAIGVLLGKAARHA